MHEPLILSDPDERAAAQAAAAALAKAGGATPVVLHVHQGQQVLPIPMEAWPLVGHLLADLAAGRMVGLHALGEELTTQQAADLLNVSRPYLVKLLEQGTIPFRLVGSRRRVRRDDLLAFKALDREHRRAALRRLGELTQELGLYDD